jgi:hypothetical protein
VSVSSTIFLSYAREDSEIALKLTRDLKAAGVPIWLDQLDIPPGKRWDRAVEAALQGSKCLLVLLSPNSVSSENVMDEVSYAMEEEKQIVPVIVQKCRLPLRMRRLQFIDLTRDYNASLEQLLRVLGNGRDRKESPGEKDATVSSSEALPIGPVKLRDVPASSAPGADSLAVAGKAVVDGLRSMYKKVIPCNGHTIEVRHFGKIKVRVLYDGKEIPAEAKSKPSGMSAMFSTTAAYTFQMVEEGSPVLYEVAWGSRWHGMEYWHEVRRNGETVFKDR